MSKLSRRVALLTSLSALLFAAPAAEAATVTVCATGCDQTTIQDAVNFALPGDTVQVSAGTYTENVTMPGYDLVIRGAQAGTDARGRTGAETIVVPASAAAPTFANTIGASYTFNGLTIDGSSTADVGAIESNGSVSIVDTIVRTSDRAVEVIGADGDETVAVSRSRLVYEAQGVHADNAASVTVEDSQLEGTVAASDAVSADADQLVAVRRSRISGVAAARGVHVIGGDTNDTTEVVDNDLLGLDPALETAGSYIGTVDLHRNRITRASATSHAIVADGTAAVNAGDNWFACDGTPATSGACELFAGTTPQSIAVPTWFALTATAGAATLAPGANTGVTASIRRNDGTALPSGVTVLEGLATTFALTGGGTITPLATTLAAGTAAGVLTAPDAGGPQVATATIDGVTATAATVNVVGTAPTPSGTPVVTGERVFGNVLTCQTPTWSAPGTGAISWTRNGAAIAGAIGTTYTSLPTDVGAAIGCSQAWTSGFRAPASTTSAPITVARQTVKLGFAQVTAKGAKLKCGASTKACVVAKQGGVAYVRPTATPLVVGAATVSLFVERKVGRKWVPVKLKPAITGKVTATTIKLPASRLGAGVFRVRAKTNELATLVPATSPYSYLVVR